MLVIVGIALWALFALLIVKIKKGLPYGGGGGKDIPIARTSQQTGGSDEVEVALQAQTVHVGPSSRWASLDPPTTEASSSDEEEVENEERAEEAEAEEEEENVEEIEEKEEEEWEDDSEEEEGGTKEKKPKETCKMQFIILNTGPRNTRLHSGALCDTIANLAIKNIVRVRELEGDMTQEDLQKDPIRAEWLRAYRVWDAAGVTKITLRCDTREAFDAVVAKASTELNLPVNVKVFGPNIAIAALGPSPSDTLTSVTGHLKLLS